MCELCKGSLGRGKKSNIQLTSLSEAEPLQVTGTHLLQY